ncbi:MAG: ankyrin repeat domain-containing protein [Planctomycetaceae bacterium]|jgi:ankyrin repeat protein|nr:ankyrin repeat domain-containing protein [Planctomycetaceae bacterium]
MYYYYYDNDGQKQGPYSGGQLRNLSREGKITLDTLIETEDEKTYQANKLKGLVFSEMAQSETPIPAVPNPFITPPPVPENPFVGTQSVPENPFTAPMPIANFGGQLGGTPVPVGANKVLYKLKTAITCVLLLLVLGGAGWVAVSYLFALPPDDREFIDDWRAEHGDIVNGLDEEGKTAFQHAVSAERLALVKYIERLAFVKRLIFQGANVHTKSDKKGTLPLHWAAENNENIEVIEYLITKEYINVKDENGNTPLHRAAAFNKHVDVVKYLVSKGADVHEKNVKDGATPLHWAAGYNENIEVIEYLLSQGEDIHAKDKNGDTPLHWAATYNKNVEVVKYLVSEGADIHAKGKKSETPLYRATNYNKNNIEVIEYLTSQDGDAVNKKDAQDGNTIDLTKADGRVETPLDKADEGVDDAAEIRRQQAQTAVEKFVGIAESAAREAENAETKAILAVNINDVVTAAKEATAAAKKVKDAAEDAKDAAMGYDFTEIVRRAIDAESRAARAENSAKRTARKIKEKDSSYMENLDEWVKESGWSVDSPLSYILIYGTQELENKLKSEKEIARNDAFEREEATAVIKSIEEKIREEQDRIARKIFYCDVKFGVSDRGEIIVNDSEAITDIYVLGDNAGLGIGYYYRHIAKGASGLWRFDFPITSYTAKMRLGSAECGIITGKTDVMKKFYDNRGDYILRVYLTGLQYDAEDFSNHIKYKVVQFEIRKKEIGDDWVPLDGDPFMRAANNGGNIQPPFMRAANNGTGIPVQFNGKELEEIRVFDEDNGWHLRNPRRNIDNVISEDVNSKDVRGETLLHKAARKGNLIVTKFLIVKRAIVDIKDKDGETPLHEAAKSNQYEVADYLLDKGAKVNEIDKAKNTPLHLLAKVKDAKILFTKLLVHNGADVNALDNVGRTPLHLLAAREYGDVEFAKYLVANGADISITYNDGKGKKTAFDKAEESNNTKLKDFLKPDTVEKFLKSDEMKKYLPAKNETPTKSIE